MRSKLTIGVSLFFIVIVISVAYRLAIDIALIIFALCTISTYFISKMINKEDNRLFVEKKLLIANKEIIQSLDFVVLIVKDNKIKWANNLSYSEFPILLKNRSVESINLDKINNDNIFEYQNQSYIVKIEDGVYFIENITQEKKNIETLTNKQTNIIFLNIDNYQYLEDQLTTQAFNTIIRDVRIEILRFFDLHNIFYQEFEGEKYQLIVPENELRMLIANKFEELHNLFKKFQNDEITMTYSMGIAIDQPSVRATGYKAIEALDLAISRGGAQTVIFDGEQRRIFGGGTNIIHGSSLMKARLMNSTILNIMNKRDAIYLMSHQNPDSDAIASMVLLYELIRNRFDTPIKIVIDEKKIERVKNLIDNPDNLEIISNVVVNEKITNLVVVLDTQSSKYVSNPDILDIINDIVIIDHHQTPDEAIYNPIIKWIEPGVSSTVEMLMQMFSISQTKLTNKKLATYALYGILIDTNILTYRVSEITLDMVKRLVNSGAKMIDAKKMTFEDINEFKELNKLTKNVVKVNNFTLLEIEDIDDHILLSRAADSILEINQIRASIVISKVKEIYMIKLRSMGEINCKLFIEEFGGGGHAAQGAAILSEEQYQLFIEKIKTYNKE